MFTQIVLIGLALAVLAFLIVRRRYTVGREIVIAAVIAAGWTAFYGYSYIDHPGYFLGPINLFSFTLWVAGLVVLREVYERLPGVYWKRLLFAAVFYWLFLGIAEAVGFYVLGIQVTPQYPSLFNLGILHIPPFAQAFYLAIGPVYLLLTDYLKVR